MRGTPKLARSRACGGASVRSPALRRAERARGFSLISSFDGDNGRRLRSRKLGKKFDSPFSGKWREPFGAGTLRAAKKRLAMRSSSEWKVTTASLPSASRRCSAALKRPRELEKLLIEIEAERLEGPRRRVLGSSGWRPSTRATMSASSPVRVIGLPPGGRQWRGRWRGRASPRRAWR